MGNVNKAITTKALEALREANNGDRLSMGESLYGKVRASKDGSVSVYVDWRYRFNGKVRTLAIGTWPNQSLKALRDRRDELQAELRSGIDPAERMRMQRLEAQADLQEAKAAQQARLDAQAALAARMTVRDLFSLWKRLELRNKRADQGEEVARAFERDVFPLIGQLAAQDVTKAHVQSIVDNMMTRNVVRMTKRVLADMRQMFGFAIERDYLDADPTARIKKAKLGKDGDRTRVLSEAELIDLFRRLPESGLTEASQCALLIQLSTATRIGEVLAAKWEHVDQQRKQWTLPDTKNGKPHAVHLSEFALQQFNRLQRHTGLTPFCFPASRTEGPVCPKTVTKQVADRQRGGESPMRGRSKQTSALSLSGGAWRPHDLRRTAATLMAELGALPEVVERCLNHTEENRMKRIYQRAQYEGPMRDAWTLLSERLTLLNLRASGLADNLMTLPRRA